MDYKNFCRVSSLFLVKKKKREIYMYAFQMLIIVFMVGLLFYS